MNHIMTGRQATEKERTHGGVLKDMDLVLDKTKLILGTKKEAFMIQIEKDAMFLAKLNIMDYSLLVRTSLLAKTFSIFCRNLFTLN